MKKATLVLAIVLLAGAAQAAPFLVCDPQEGVVGYALAGLTEQTIAAQTDGSLKYDLASLPPGTYPVSVAACNLWGDCGAPVPFDLKRRIPAAAAGLRLQAR